LHEDRVGTRGFAATGRDGADMRALILVMDSVGIGAAPDAARYGDEGADTVGHIAEACLAGAADNACREGPLRVPNLVSLGLGVACLLATGRTPAGLEVRTRTSPSGCASEISKGKDTPSGHWEIAGVPVPFDWEYFPKSIPCFPDDLAQRLCAEAGLPEIHGNCHASGTQIIADLGERHMRSGEPICYTSADSVFQIAAHRDIVSIGKIDDIFAHRGTGRNMRGDGNDALFDATLDGLDGLAEGGLLFANFVDFDTTFGHRREVAGICRGPRSVRRKAAAAARSAATRRSVDHHRGLRLRSHLGRH
jgi:phosphopentomutase